MYRYLRSEGSYVFLTKQYVSSMISIFVQTIERLAGYVHETDLRRLVAEKFEYYINHPLNMAADLWSTYLTLVVSFVLLKRFAGQAIKAFSDYKKLRDNVSHPFVL